MNDERSEELTSQERAAYESLADPVAPPPECEARVVEELRARGLVRGAAKGGVGVPFWRRLVPLVPRVSFAAAALAGAFFLGAEYGRRADVAEAPDESTDPFPAVEKIEEGEIYKNADGEMVASVRVEPVAFHPGRPLELAGNEKPPISRDSDFLYGEYPLYPLDGSMPSVSPRVP
jgi:hypothetical protein